jgi:hypothetical protein
MKAYAMTQNELNNITQYLLPHLEGEYTYLQNYHDLYKTFLDCRNQIIDASFKLFDLEDFLERCEKKQFRIKDRKMFFAYREYLNKKYRDHLDQFTISYITLDKTKSNIEVKLEHMIVETDDNEEDDELLLPGDDAITIGVKVEIANTLNNIYSNYSDRMYLKQIAKLKKRKLCSAIGTVIGPEYSNKVISFVKKEMKKLQTFTKDQVRILFPVIEQGDEIIVKEMVTKLMKHSKRNSKNQN